MTQFVKFVKITSNRWEIRQYKVYVPESYDGSRPVPMVFALHGCNMDHIDVLNDWNWDLAADEHSFIVVFPFVSQYGFSEGMRSDNCWGYFFDLHIHQGQGEVHDNISPHISIACSVAGSSLRVEGEASDEDGTITKAKVIISKYSEPEYNHFRDIDIPGSFDAFSVDADGLPAGIYKVHTEMTGTASTNIDIECALPPSTTGTIQSHCEQGRLSWTSYSHYYLKYMADPFTI